MGIGSSLGQLFVNIGLKSTIDRDAKTAQSSLGRLSGGIQKHGLMVGAAATAMGASMVLAGDQINSAYADIRIGTGATGEALEDLKDSFHDVYGSIPAEADAVSGALANMNTLTGATGETLEELTTHVLEVSRMLGEDGVNNAQSFGEAMKQWQIPAEEGTALMDQMFKITQDTGIGFGELTSALNTYGPVMQNANFSTTEAAELFGELKSSGIAVSRVMPGLNKAFRTWAEEGKNGREELEKQVEAIKNAKSNTEALTIATGTFGAEGAQRMTTAIRNGTFELESLGEGLEDVDGLIAETAKETLTLSDKFGLLKTKMTEALAPFEGVGYALSLMGPILMGLGPMMTAFSAIQTGTVIPGLVAHTAAAWAAVAPYLAIAAPIIAVVAVLYILEKKFGFVTKAVEMLKVILSKAIEFLKGIFVDGIEKAKNLIGTFGDKLLFLLGPIGAVIYAIKNWEEIWTFIKELFGKIIGFLTGLAGKFKDAGKALMQAMIDGIKSLISKPADLIRDALGKVRDLLSFSDAKVGPLSDLLESGRGVLKTFAAGMESARTDIGGTFEKTLPTVTAKEMTGGGGVSYGGSSITINSVNLSKDYDFEAFMKDVENYQQSKRVQRGINAI